MPQWIIVIFIHPHDNGYILGLGRRADHDPLGSSLKMSPCAVSIRKLAGGLDGITHARLFPSQS